MLFNVSNLIDQELGNKRPKSLLSENQIWMLWVEAKCFIFDTEKQPLIS